MTSSTSLASSSGTAVTAEPPRRRALRGWLGRTTASRRGVDWQRRPHDLPPRDGTHDFRPSPSLSDVPIAFRLQWRTGPTAVMSRPRDYLPPAPPFEFRRTHQGPHHTPDDHRESRGQIDTHTRIEYLLRHRHEFAFTSTWTHRPQVQLNRGQDSRGSFVRPSSHGQVIRCSHARPVGRRRRRVAGPYLLTRPWPGA